MWKEGCEYAIGGTVKGGTFRAADKGTNDNGKNPDTLERDHATRSVCPKRSRI